MSTDAHPANEWSDAAQPASRRATRGLLVCVLVVGAAMLAASGIVHLYLWGSAKLDYRSVPTVGPLFLAQGIVGCILAGATLIVRRSALAILGAAYMALSIGGLYLSIHGGLFGFDETWDAPWVKFAFVVEVVGLVAFVGALVLLLAGGRTTTVVRSAE